MQAHRLSEDEPTAPGSELVCDDEQQRVPPLAVVMLVCGTRGDVQPFIALGLKLKARPSPAAVPRAPALRHTTGS